MTACACQEKADYFVGTRGLRVLRSLLPQPGGFEGLVAGGKDSDSLNPSFPYAGDVKDPKGNRGFALCAPGVVSGDRQIPRRRRPVKRALDCPTKVQSAVEPPTLKSFPARSI
jgi:hypothetical protein